MRRVFKYSGGADRADSFGEHVRDRRAFLHPRQQMMRVTSDANRTLSRDQELHQLRMTGMKFHVVRGNFFEQRDSLVEVLVLMIGESNEQFGIARLCQKFTLPLRIGEVLKVLRFVLLLQQTRIPRGHDSIYPRAYP